MKKIDWELIIPALVALLGMLFFVLFGVAAIKDIFSGEVEVATVILFALLSAFFLTVAIVLYLLVLLKETREAVREEYKKNPGFSEKSTEAVYEFITKKIRGKNGLRFGLLIYLFFADILPPIKKALFRQIQQVAREKSS